MYQYGKFDTIHDFVTVNQFTVYSLFCREASHVTEVM